MAAAKCGELKAVPDSEYFTCPLYDRDGITELLGGISLASCTPSLEQDLYSMQSSIPGVALDELKIGSVVIGEVTSCIRSGVFLDIGVGFEGFVHKSALQGQRVVCGSRMKVSVVSLDVEQRRIALKMESLLNHLGSLKDPELSISTKMACSICSAVFGNRDEQVVHYKLDWHRYNLKQRMLSCRPVTEETFDNLADGISSLSGSESESEDTPSAGEDSSSSDAFSSPRRRRSKPLSLPIQNIGRRERSSSVNSTDTESEDVDVASKSRIHPKVFLRNKSGQMVALYRCVVHGKDNFPATHGDLIGLIELIPSQMKWAVLLVGGGHFAAAIFNGAEVLQHKTFHRYTVRAKQGGAQGSKDSKGHQPKSAGATLRRHNEAALIKDVQDVMALWGDELRQCNRIFYRAPSFNRVALFGGKTPPFRKDDVRLRTIPFPTRRATHREVLRVHKLLATIECFGEHSAFVNNLPRSPRMYLGKKKKKGDSETTDNTVPQPESRLPLDNNTTEDQSSPKKQLDYSGAETSSSFASDSETSFRLEMVEETINLQESLQEFEVARKPRKKRGQRKKGTNPKRQEDPMAGEKYRFKAALYGACKSGDVQSLLSLLVSLDGSIKTKIISPIIEEPSKSNSVAEKTVQELIDATVPRKKHHSGGYSTDDEIESHRRNRVRLSSSLDSQLGQYMRTGLRTKNAKTEDEEPALTIEVLREAVNEGGTTFLHVASEAGHGDLLRILMENGADPTARNKQNQTPYMIAKDKETRNEFRRFRAKYPNNFDYAKAQIPSPLTEETEKDQMAKEAQWKKEKRKVRKEKVKEKKVIAQQKKADDDERARFLSLSDREKRALAAERRLVERRANGSKEITVLSRCFKCAVDITGKVPFEYNNNRFCSMQCLKEHRKTYKEVT